jgi:soluble lytic murein transglycosylase-like protein
VAVAVAAGWVVHLLALPAPVRPVSSVTARLAAGLPGGPAPGEVVSSSALAAVEEANAGRQVLAGTPAAPSWRTAAVVAAAQTSGLPAALVAAVIQVESEGDPLAVSPAGAEGLMQLEPATAAALGVHNIFDARQNAIGGARYLATWLQVYGGPSCVPHPTTCLHALSLALAAYNAGPGAVQSYGGIPPYPLVHLYVSEVEAIYQSYRAAP